MANNKLHLILSLSMFCLIGLNCANADTGNDYYVGARGAYLTAQNRHQPAIYTGINATNGFGAVLTETFDAGKMDQLKSEAAELEMWYPYLRPSEDWILHVGSLADSFAAGSNGGIYTGATYLIDKTQNVMFRYRFNYQNFDTLNASNELKRYYAHMFVLTYSWDITEKLNYYFESEYYIALNDFRQANGKKTSGELHSQLSYKIDKHWQPYVEIAWLDRNISCNAEEYRVRWGINYHF
ncbi:MULTISPECIES: oligogalacturonate-specific porin KdgM family protein [unclassified Raoultella]|uniref:oligogalacturonate-specific porin KdgM family protein n=1 Tax=unclassified Raoultella TaxID=2627600 RepID=UPI00135B656B|nr:MULTISPECIES: oligogalacturonate-specific porin KdgM family protein [unclassified Raoultella]